MLTLNVDILKLFPFFSAAKTELTPNCKRYPFDAEVISKNPIHHRKILITRLHEGFSYYHHHLRAKTHSHYSSLG